MGTPELGPRRARSAWLALTGTVNVWRAAVNVSALCREWARQAPARTAESGLASGLRRLPARGGSHDGLLQPWRREKKWSDPFVVHHKRGLTPVSDLRHGC